ncbi:MAG: cupin domain-containing protein [Sedimentisphaerales bacterium]|nr:cupin domain-containing protein [Sedimentisphaerales bacterium]
MSKYKIDFESKKWESPAVGVRFKAYEQNSRKLRLVEFFKEFIEPDWCKKGHIGYVLEGQMEIDFNGTKKIFGPGDGVFIPSGEKHKHKGKVLTEKFKVILVEEA